jgi:hypothetical protein
MTRDDDESTSCPAWVIGASATRAKRGLTARRAFKGWSRKGLELLFLVFGKGSSGHAHDQSAQR